MLARHVCPNLVEMEDPQPPQLPQQRALKAKLEGRWRAFIALKRRLKMSNGLQEEIGLHVLRRILHSEKPRPQIVQLLAKFASQPVKGFQGKSGVKAFNRSLERNSSQPLNQPFPQQRGREGVAKESVDHKERKGSPATAATARLPRLEQKTRWPRVTQSSTRAGSLP